jgi:hypothetical protein
METDNGCKSADVTRLILRSFEDTANSSDYIVSNGRLVKNKLEIIWKEAVVA